MQSAWLFAILKLAGAACLIWLGIISLRSALHGEGCLFPDLFSSWKNSHGSFR